MPHLFQHLKRGRDKPTSYVVSNKDSTKNSLSPGAQRGRFTKVHDSSSMTGLREDDSGEIEGYSVVGVGMALGSLPTEPDDTYALVGCAV